MNALKTRKRIRKTHPKNPLFLTVVTCRRILASTILFFDQKLISVGRLDVGVPETLFGCDGVSKSTAAWIMYDRYSMAASNRNSLFRCQKAIWASVSTSDQLWSKTGLWRQEWRRQSQLSGKGDSSVGFPNPFLVSTRHALLLFALWAHPSGDRDELRMARCWRWPRHFAWCLGPLSLLVGLAHTRIEDRHDGKGLSSEVKPALMAA